MPACNISQTALDLTRCCVVRSAAAILGISVLVCSAEVAFGQSTSRQANVREFYQPVPSWPVEMNFSYHHASTYAEGAQRGAAEVIQAQGNYLLNASQAEILNQQALSLGMQNEWQRIEYRRSLRSLREKEKVERLAKTRSWNLARQAQRQKEALRVAAGEADDAMHADLVRE